MGDAAPRVGLVLGAGGVAGGAFHAGVLAALEEATGWDPRGAGIVVGTSAGSIAGTSLRAGLSATDMLARAEDRPLSVAGTRLMQRVGPPRRPPSLRPTQPPRAPAQLAGTLARAAARPFAARPWALIAGLIPEGSVSTDVISNGIGALLPGEWPSDPLWICAVRQRDGRRLVFGKDSRPGLPDAVAASCAIPGFFSPVTIGGEPYIDGGVHSPTNADVLADAGPDLDLVLVSSPMSLSGRGVRLAADQAVRRWSGALLDSEAFRLRRRGMSVVAFQPTAEDAGVMGVNAMDASRRTAIARRAYESTLRRLARTDTQARLAPLR
ncbi:MAG: patatin-like phospholipase family protein [Acidimicrobiales bacterium]